MAKLIDEVRRLLRGDGRLDSLSNCERPRLIRTLNMLISDADDIVKQRACRKLGRVITTLPRERMHDFLRRLLWRLNPEAGDNPVGVPELFAEIVYNEPEQNRSFVPPFLFYFDEVSLWSGMLQASGRIGEQLPDVLVSYLDEISPFQRNNDVIVASNAVLALRRIGGDKAEKALRLAEHDVREVKLYCGGKYNKVSLSDLASHECKRQNNLCFIAGTGRIFMPEPV